MRREPEHHHTIWLPTVTFSISIASGIGFLWVYWSDEGHMLLGGTLALCLGALGISLVLWGRWFTVQEEVTSPREDLPSAERERQLVFEEFFPPNPKIKRRGLLIGMSAVVAGTLAAAAISLFRSFYGSAPMGNPLMGTVWKRGERLITEHGDAVSIDMLKPGGFITVFPEGKIDNVGAETVLLRVQEHLLQLPPDRASWAPKGYVAYSRVCTHAGCPVGLVENEVHMLLCPCHQSTFNILDGAQPTGGPAARPLPQLPLYVAPDGTLRAAGDFTNPPGPGFWNIPS